MPIKIPDTLPARETLVREGVAVLSDSDAIRQDIRPLQIGLLNLMPNKIRTETQIARLIGASPLQIEMTLVMQKPPMRKRLNRPKRRKMRGSNWS